MNKHCFRTIFSKTYNVLWWYLN
ncbi:hypothetical protein INT82_09500 [Mannheimia haemolytica]|nr:hypothetical protein [Mannheimia haemolytica]